MSNRWFVRIVRKPATGVVLFLLFNVPYLRKKLLVYLDRKLGEIIDFFELRLLKHPDRNIIKNTLSKAAEYRDDVREWDIYLSNTLLKEITCFVLNIARKYPSHFFLWQQRKKK